MPDKENRWATFAVDAGLLRAMLKLPDDTRITGAEFGPGDTVTFDAESPQFPVVPPGGAPSEVRPFYRPDGLGGFCFAGWGTPGTLTVRDPYPKTA